MIPHWIPLVVGIANIIALAIRAHARKNWHRSIAWMLAYIPLVFAYSAFTLEIVPSSDLVMRTTIGRWAIVCALLVQLVIWVVENYQWKQRKQS